MQGSSGAISTVSDYDSDTPRLRVDTWVRFQIPKSAQRDVLSLACEGLAVLMFGESGDGVQEPAMRFTSILA